MFQVSEHGSGFYIADERNCVPKCSKDALVSFQTYPILIEDESEMILTRMALLDAISNRLMTITVIPAAAPSFY